MGPASTRPEAIGADFQVDTLRCRSHRDCVAACGEIGAIDFTRSDRERSEKFDLVFDLREQSMFDCQLAPQGEICDRCPLSARGSAGFDCHQPPQGYFHPGRGEAARTEQALKLAAMVGEFEKAEVLPLSREACAHGRNRIEGCHACIDVCSTRAIESAGDTIRVEPHLCMGCGGCTTVCPSVRSATRIRRRCGSASRSATGSPRIATAEGVTRACSSTMPRKARR